MTKIPELTSQETRVLDLIGKGLTNRQIAQQMFLAEKTVKNYAWRIYAKTGLRNRSSAAVHVVSEMQRADHDCGRRVLDRLAREYPALFLRLLAEENAKGPRNGQGGGGRA